MRLNPRQLDLVPALARRHFGPRARVWVFGSRLDDRARGGDYDFLVRCDELDAQGLVDARLRLLADLHEDRDFEDERIDLVLYSARLDPEPRSIHRTAMERGVEIGVAR